MDEDIVKELGYLSLASRLKRISDTMIHSGRQMYKELGWDIEPNWFLIFLTLEKHGSLSVTDIASKLQFAHPSVITIVNKMTKAGYLESTKCSEDGRRQWITLTDKAKERLPEFKRIWQAGTDGIQNMLKGYDLIPILDHIEKQLSSESFKDRTFSEYTPQHHE